MLRRVIKIFISAFVLCAFLQGCGVKPVPPVPPGVSEELNERCHFSALQASRDATEGLSNAADHAAPVAGLLGVLLIAASAVTVSEGAYSNAYEKCLKGEEPVLVIVDEDDD